MRISTLLLAAAIAAPLISAPAQAATITDQVTFTALGFSTSGGPVPVDPVTGTFLITFDPTQTYTDQTAGITLKSLNINLGSALSFSYNPTGPSADELIVGGAADGASMVQFNPPTDDFWLFIDTFTTSPTFDQVGYAQVSAGPSIFFTDKSAGGSGTVTVGPPPSGGVPEPATWAVMLTGFGGVGLAMRWRRKSVLATA
jgi:hypothetical protein